MPCCRVCQSDLEPFIDFGRMPLANGFLTPNQFATEYFFNLSAAQCARCTLVQLVEQPRPGLMFNERYPFFSSSSAHMTAHFGLLARGVIAALTTHDPFVVEIGSNDGTLLRHAAAAGIRHLGVEPSASVAAAATARGVTTIERFFDSTLAHEIVAEHGPADAVIAANALSHMADPNSVVAGIGILLSAHGKCVIEDPYWGQVVARTAFDQIYDEHASYFTLASLSYLFAQHDLQIVDVVPFDVHGGSMRYEVRRAGTRAASPAVQRLLDQERAAGLHQRATVAAFRQRVEANGSALIKLLRDRRAQGLRVVGYGATTKSTTTINYSGITPDLIEFTSDTTPAKHGTFTPGAHIPVRPHAEFAARYPDRALLFSWNHAAEVRANEEGFARAGGQWIRYVPEVEES